MKKFTDLRESYKGSVSVKTQQHDFGKMMTVHHGSNTSYPLHPEHQKAIKKLRPGDKTAFKDETGSQVHAHRVGDDVILHRPLQGSGLSKVPYHHFDTSKNEETEQIDELSKGTLSGFIKKSKETFKDVPNKKKGNRLRNVLIAAGKKDLKKEEVSTRVYKPEVERAFPASGVKTIEPKHKYSTMPKDKEKAKGMPAGAMRKEEAEQVDEAQMSHKEIQHAVEIHKLLKNNTPGMSFRHSRALSGASSGLVKKHGSNWRRKAGIVDAGVSQASIYKEEIQSIEEGPKDPPWEKSASPFKKPNNPNRSMLDTVKALAQKGKKEAEKKSIKETFKSSGLSSANSNAEYKRNDSNNLKLDVKHLGGISDHKAIKQHLSSKGITAGLGSSDNYQTVHLSDTNHSHDKVKKMLGIKEGYSEEDIANGGTVIFKADNKHHMSKVSHKTGGGAGTIIHTTAGHKVPLHHVVSTDASDWKGLKEATGDKSFDSTMKNIVKGTSKQRTADRIAQKKQNQERARNAFGSMFGGGNPTSSLKVKEDMDKEAKQPSRAKAIMALTRVNKSYVKVHNPNNDKVNENSLHADFLKMMNDKGIKHRVHGTPEQEKARTAEKLASNKAKVDASPKKPAGSGTFGTTKGYGQGRYMGD